MELVGLKLKWTTTWLIRVTLCRTVYVPYDFISFFKVKDYVKLKLHVILTIDKIKITTCLI
jgi:hypothetical protein